DRVQEILGRGRRSWPAQSFLCHKTINYDEAGNSYPPTAQQCAGVMIILAREGRPNHAMQLAERFGLFDPSRLDMSAPVHQSIEAAVRAQRVSLGIVYRG